MQTPHESDPLYAQSGCLYSEDDIPICRGCKCEITIDIESDDPEDCIYCFTLAKIMAKMRKRYDKVDLTSLADKDNVYLYQPTDTTL